MSTPGAETILITVDIAANNQRLVELTKQLNENKEAQKALADANKAGRLSADELAAGQVRLKQTAADIAQETRILTKANADQTNANKSSAGSIAQLRAELALGTKAYNSLSQSERDNTDAGQKLQANNKALSDSLKRLEGAVGDTRRNVGNYNEGIKDVNVVSGQLTGGLKSAVDKGLSPFKNELERGTGLLGKFKSGSDLVKTGLESIKGAGEAGSLGFKAIAGGIALTGIGLFVIAISAVVSYFTQTAEGGKQLAIALGYLGGVLQVVTDTITGFGKAVVYAFTHPLEAIKDFGRLIGQALTDPIGFARQLAAGFVNFTSRANESGLAVGAFAGRAKELLIARRELDKQDAIEESRVSVLLRLSKERGKAAGDQIKALEDAGQLERKITEDNIALKEKELKLIDDRIKAAGKSKTADLKADKAAKELEIIQAGTRQDEVNAKIQVRESVFKEKQRTEAKAAALAQREDVVKAKQTEVEQLLLTVQKASAAELVLLQRQIQLAADLTLAAATQTAAEKRLILAKSEGDIQQLQADFNAKSLEDAKKHTAATAAEANREYTEALAALENYLNQKRAAVERDYALGKTGENEYQKQLNAIEKAGNAAALVNAKDYGKGTGAIEKKTADDEIKERNRVKAEKKKIKDTEQAIQEAGFQTAAAGAQLVIDLMGQETAAGQAALAIKKTLALAEIAINLQKQLSANATYGATLGPLGIAYTVTTDALAIAGAVAAAAKIAGFKQGGYVSGPGTGTSDSITARLSNGESVMNANSTSMFAPLLSHLNQLGGGVAFPGYASGGVIGNRPAANDGGLLARALGGYVGPTAKEIAYELAKVVPREISVKAVTGAQQQQASVTSRATLG